MGHLRITRIIVLAWMLVLPASGFADLQQEMDAMFGTMTNVTTPTAHLGQRRGVITGGSVVSRNKIVETNLVSFQPPSFSAGCGGIDLFGGSFSFINKDQFITLMRSVAANATGYAFQLAIDAMCNQCGVLMSGLQKRIQDLNQMFSNSCQLAQGIVNDATSLLPASVTENMKKSKISFSKGVTDVFGALTNTSTQGDPTKQVSNNAPTEMKKIIQGNLVWRALNEKNAKNWFQFGGLDLLEAMMSISGTVIVNEPSAASDGQGDTNPVVVLNGIIGMKELLNGSGSGSYSKVKIYDCDTTEIDGCLNPVIKDVTLVGLRKRVSDLLIGNSVKPGLVYKFGTNTGDLTLDEMAFMELVPGAVAAMIRNMARQDYGMARLFAEDAAPAIALELAQAMVQNLYDAARYASSLEDSAYAAKLADTLSVARQQIEDDSTELAMRYGNIKAVVDFYSNIMKATPTRNYAAFDQTGASAANYPTQEETK
ncbi:conjugal transfer protein TraH [Methylomonas sp. SURF-1]|uniref:Conjugal transfer protein TraH n=1 Tax=Methylomonas aurea TaxID=2952224 RepID=A0ABT1UMN6_9GAMM|nr:conjugal transfer protein TraH [Methylomonas sp. SURF-1]MCQ8183505.1 conjugal transfer protein TraH [Methylomonas sp. SURF-1]